MSKKGDFSTIQQGIEQLADAFDLASIKGGKKHTTKPKPTTTSDLAQRHLRLRRHHHLYLIRLMAITASVLQ